MSEFDRNRTATVFPGQSSLDVGRRDLVEEWSPELLDVLADALGEGDPFALADESLAAEQAVTVSCSLAYWHAHGRPASRYVVGHALGELTALASAGAIAEHDAVRLAAVRGDLMQRASDASPGCGMISVRAPLFDIEAIAEDCGVSVAFHNAPRQAVLAGSREGLECADAALAEVGIHCTARLRGAFNSPLMEPAVAPFRAALDQCEISPPQATVYSATTCRPMIDVRDELAQGLVAPVRWWETLARLAMEGVDNFIEICVGGLVSPLPDGIVIGRAEHPAPGDPESEQPEAADPQAGTHIGILAAVADTADIAGPDSGGETIFAYFDDQNRMHVLV
jgi:[acyl-carrier-protein] S-malonyltransferase